MLSAIADYERTQIRERLEAGKEYAKAKGTKSGKPMHRPSITIDWAKFDELENKGLSIPSMGKTVQTGRIHHHKQKN
jgi:DNA invertase Pin-like site-specific DNA recombinase